MKPTIYTIIVPVLLFLLVTPGTVFPAARLDPLTNTIKPTWIYNNWEMAADNIAHAAVFGILWWIISHWWLCGSYNMVCY